jgi:Uma2 family endonuclease
MTEPAPTTSPLVRRYSLDEFFALPEPGDGSHYDLIAGVLYVVPPPGGSHHVAVSYLVETFGEYARMHPGTFRTFVPRAALWTSPDTYVEPDLFLVASGRLVGTDVSRLETADLVVEVLSPATAIYDRNTKADTYAALGVSELWLVDVERRMIEVRTLAGGRWGERRTFAGDDVVASARFPGLAVVARDVFAAA